MTAAVIPFPKDRIRIERRIGIAREIETMEDILNRWREHDRQIEAPWYEEWLAKWYGADGKSMPPTYPRRR